MQGKSDPNVELLDAAALCGHLVADDSVHAFLAEHRGVLFPDGLFEDLFPSGRGRPSVPADVIATVMVLQALEGLSDRDALAAVRTNIGWKVAAGLSLADEGFHPTVLTLWRRRLGRSEAPERIFDAVRAVVAETGVLKNKTRRALDSTVLDDAVATQDTVTQLIGAVRRVRRVVPAARAIELAGHDYDDPGKPRIAWDDQGARDALVSALVTDARRLLDALDGVELSVDQSDATGLLALVAGQDVEPGATDGTWRIARRTAPDRVISTVDPDARHIHKTVHNYRDGYKAHVAVEPESGLVTACALTAGNISDAHAAPGLLADEPAGLEILADSAYGAGEFRAALAQAKHTTHIKPPPLARPIEGGFTIDDFTIDVEHATVTCPAGVTVGITPARTATFGAKCRGCALRDRCTRAQRGRTLTIHKHHQLLAAAREHAKTEEFIHSYRQHRPLVERSLAWLVARGHRKVRYRGVARNQIWLAHRCAAINLRRLINLGLHHTDTSWAITPTA